jgi:hypothetical protein
MGALPGKVDVRLVPPEPEPVPDLAEVDLVVPVRGRRAADQRGRPISAPMTQRTLRGSRRRAGNRRTRLATSLRAGRVSGTATRL